MKVALRATLPAVSRATASNGIKKPFNLPALAAMSTLEVCIALSCRKSSSCAHFHPSSHHDALEMGLPDAPSKASKRLSGAISVAHVHSGLVLRILIQEPLQLFALLLRGGGVVHL